MHSINNNQHFLLLPELNLCPEINTNTISMIEQIMNAHVLLNSHNIQCGVERVLELEYYCQQFLSDAYDVLLIKLTPMLNKYNIHIAQGEQVRGMYPLYHKTNKYYSEVGKQTAINLDFALDKKLSYDGLSIIWENTYIDWVDRIMLKQEELSEYNTADKLLFTRIQPKTMNSRLDIKDIILEETQKYMDEYRQKLLALQDNKPC